MRSHFYVGPDFAITSPQLVGSTKATTPPSESTNDPADSVIIPVPAEAATGDRLLALLQWPGVDPGPLNAPAGWDLILSSERDFLLYRAVLHDTDPAEFEWTADEEKQPKSGIMLAVRGGVEGELSGIVAQSGMPVTVPSVEVTTSAGLVLSFCAYGNGSEATETLAANSPLILAVQHAGDGTASYTVPALTGAASESPGVGTVSGRTFDDPETAVRVRAAALVMERG